jgi:hypothetical protein
MIRPDKGLTAGKWNQAGPEGSLLHGVVPVTSSWASQSHPVPGPTTQLQTLPPAYLPSSSPCLLPAFPLSPTFLPWLIWAPGPLCLPPSHQKLWFLFFEDLFLFYFFVVQGIEPMVLWLLGKHSITNSPSWQWDRALSVSRSWVTSSPQGPVWVTSSDPSLFLFPFYFKNLVTFIEHSANHFKTYRSELSH